MVGFFQRILRGQTIFTFKAYVILLPLLCVFTNSDAHLRIAVEEPRNGGAKVKIWKFPLFTHSTFAGENPVCTGQRHCYRYYFLTPTRAKWSMSLA